MPNFLNLIFQPQFKHEVFFRLMSEFRKGGLNPDNIGEFITECENLPPLPQIRPLDLQVFQKFELEHLSDEDHLVLMRELRKRAKEQNKKCWHPEAGVQNCDTNGAGKIEVSGAHSIQNNGILNRIAEDGHVKTHDLEKAKFEGKQIGRNLASVFWGFCNFHDQIFRSIETEEYQYTPQQNFLFAYRAFVVSSHKKEDNSLFIEYGEQAENDTLRTKEIFDEALLQNNYEIIETDMIELPVYYPFAVSSCFYLDYDFEGKPIPHSEKRMEYIYLSLFPTQNKTLVLLSYFSEDSELYSELAGQLIERDNLLSDLSGLIAAHCENIFFSPTYYDTFIQQHEESLEKLIFESQFDVGTLDNKGNLEFQESFTLPTYLQNHYNIQLFGYEGV